MKSSSSVLKPLLGAILVGLASTPYAAVTLNLTSTGATGQINGATYTQMAQQPTGTGYIDPFVRVGMQGSAGKDQVQAYNTTVDGVFNNSNEDNWNHEVQFKELLILGNPGSQYVQFLLDINQTSANPILNLDEVQIFISTTPNQSTESFNGLGLLNLAGNRELVYQMDAGDVANKVTLDYSLNSGSGSGDLYLNVPVSMFTTAFNRNSDGGSNAYNGTTDKNNAYIYLYSKFGSDPYNNNDGFEEWAFLAKTAPDGGGGFSGGVPEPSSLLLAGLGILAIRAARKRQRFTV